MPKTKKDNIAGNATVARSDDGTIQITFTVPFTDIKKAKEEVAKEYSDKTDIPGFRPGKAPINKVLEKIPENTLLEKSLSKILPGLLTAAISEHKITPAIYPKFELVSAKDNEDWQIRAVTCELPVIELGNYKNILSAKNAASSIWTPDKDGKDKPKEVSREEKEREVIKTLLENIKVNVSKVLVDEEVNTRLSNLLERIEKLGLNLDSYLTSIKKTAQELRNDYEIQAKSAISLDLILTKIAEEEKLTVDEKEIDAAVRAGSADKNLAEELNTPERRRFIEAILKRRKALDSVTSLV
jgi:FKBP-type peptidyl-prolyl cis-trans isomerase (trigger factor)